ncbi:hypothetical protein BDM02DRAFT_3133478, partial [Thelephora ganbajun]
QGSENAGDPDTKLSTVATIEEGRDFDPRGVLATYSQHCQPSTSKTSHHDPSILPGRGSLLPVNFGCKWDPVNYSCAYDCVFTAFTWIYLHATRSWQEKWARESLMAGFLSIHFKNVLSGLSGPTPIHTVPALFAKGRDTWRDQLSHHSPADFPRRGPEYASVTRILEVLADNRSPSHYAKIVLSCGTAGCSLRMKNLEAKYYMLTPLDWSTSTGTTTSPHHESLEVWIKKHYSSPDLTKTADRCVRCQQRFSRRLVFLRPTWIWVEVFPEFGDVIIPALKISLGSATLRLATVIYHNGNHYRACLCDPSEAWWFYDGQQDGGRPTPLSKVTDERDLLQCGSKFNVTALVYCLVDR